MSTSSPVLAFVSHLSLSSRATSALKRIGVYSSVYFNSPYRKLICNKRQRGTLAFRFTFKDRNAGFARFLYPSRIYTWNKYSMRANRRDFFILYHVCRVQSFSGRYERCKLIWIVITAGEPKVSIQWSLNAAGFKNVQRSGQDSKSTFSQV
jgi:hypothetical protein